MRSRSLLPGVLGRGRERNPDPCARSLCARSTCPSIIAAGRLPPPDEEASPELWKTLRGRFVSKSETKEPNHLSLSHTNRGIMRFCQTHSAPANAFVTDLDTPHRFKALCTSGTT